MKILLVSFSVPCVDATSGASIVMHGEVEALSGHHQVTLVTFPVTDAAERIALERLRLSGKRVHVVGESLPSGIVRTKRYVERLVAHAAGWPPVGGVFYDDARLPRLLDRLIREEHFDLLQVENIGIGKFQYRSPIPTVLIEHEVLGEAPVENRGRRSFQLRLWEQFDRIQVFTPKDAALIRKAAPHLGPKVRVNPFGIDLPVNPNLKHEEANTIVFIGGFNHLPNTDAALWLGSEIMPLLRTFHAGVKLIVVGSDPPKSVQKLNCEDITVTGKVPSIRNFLERAAVVVAPLRRGGGMRVKVLQAMAHAKPVVTTSLGTEGLTGGESRIPVVIAETAAEIAGAVADLLASPYRHALGKAARTYVQAYYSWSGYRERLETIYSELKKPWSIPTPSLIKCQ